MIPQYDGLPCIEAPGHRDRDGYAFNAHPAAKAAAGGSKIAHRQAAYCYFGPPPPNKPLACHTCDNPACIRESHLFWGSYQDNNEDRDAKGRGNYITRKGECNGQCKLTDQEVREIRDLVAYGFSQRKIGAWYDVSHNYVGMLAKDLWRV